MNIEKLSDNNIEIILDLIWEFQQDHYKKYGDYYKLKENSKEKLIPFILGLVHKKNTQIFIAFDEDKPVGYIYLRIDKNTSIYKVGKYGYISNMYILPKFRKSGFAKKLINEAIKWFQDKKISRVELKVNSENENGISFWKKLGFRYQEILMIKSIK